MTSTDIFTEEESKVKKLAGESAIKRTFDGFGASHIFPRTREMNIVTESISRYKKREKERAREREGKRRKKKERKKDTRRDTFHHSVIRARRS